MHAFQKKTPSRQSQKGLTMLELLAAIAIVAVLASVVITSVQGSFRSSEISSVKRQAQVFTSAYQSYIAAGGFFGDSLRSADEAQQIADARTALDLLLVAASTPMGSVGPFLPQNPTDEWFLDANSIGKRIGADTYYIGFRSDVGFFPIEP